MNINIENEGEKLIVKVILSPYRKKRRNPQVLREMFDYDRAYQFLIKSGHSGYIPCGDVRKHILDNKFNNMSGVFTFTKKQIEEKPLEKSEDLHVQEEIYVDNKENTVLEYPKKKRRRRRKPYNTDE